MGTGNRERQPLVSLRLPPWDPLHANAAGLGAPLDAERAGRPGGAWRSVERGRRLRNAREFEQAMLSVIIKNPFVEGPEEVD